MKTNPAGVLLLAVLATWLALDSFYAVNGNEQAVIERFSELRPGLVAPGLHAKLPVLDVVRRVDARERVEVLPPLVLTLANGNQAKVAGFAVWRVTAADRFLRQSGDRASLPVAAVEAVNRVLTRTLAADSLPTLVTADAGPLLAGTLASLNAESVLRDAGISVQQLGLLNVTWTDAAREAVYAHMRAAAAGQRNGDAADREEEAAGIRAAADEESAIQLANAKRDAERVRAQGDAKAAGIYADVFGRNPEFYRFWRSLEAYRNSFGSGQDVLVLGPDSEFFRYFKDPARH